MNIWLLNNVSNDYTIFIHADRADAINGIVMTDGAPKKWATAPKFQPFREKNKKKQKVLADIGFIAPGSIVLNPKAYDTLKEFLVPFGQFLAVECINAAGLLRDPAMENEIHYFFNLTNIIDCIDTEHSETREGTIIKPVFSENATPTDAQVFKVPQRVRTDIYLNDPAKAYLEKLISDAQLTGAEFVLQ